MGASQARLNAMPLLRVHHLSLTTATSRVLDNVSMTLRAGDRVALLGPSGAGKSLLARALTGILPGSVRFGAGLMQLNGHNIADRHPALRPSQARVSMVDHDTAAALSPQHTLGQQLMMVCAGAGHSGGDIRRQAKALLLQVGLPASLMGRCPAELSASQRQRACIALALACNTPLLVADEPTLALDEASERQVLQALKDAVPQPSQERWQPTSGTACAGEAAQNKALLFITHSLGAAITLCNRALVLHQGRIVEDASIQQLLNAPQHPFSRQMIRAYEGKRPLGVRHYEGNSAVCHRPKAS